MNAYSRRSTVAEYHSVATNGGVDTLDADLSAAFSDANVRVLQSCAALEEHGHIEKPDENSPHPADLLCIDMKINVLLDLVGRILAGSQTCPRRR